MPDVLIKPRKAPRVAVPVQPVRIPRVYSIKDEGSKVESEVHNSTSKAFFSYILYMSRTSTTHAYI